MTLRSGWKCSICGYVSHEKEPYETCPYCHYKCTFIHLATDYRVNPECC